MVTEFPLVPFDYLLLTRFTLMKILDCSLHLKISKTCFTFIDLFILLKKNKQICFVTTNFKALIKKNIFCFVLTRNSKIFSLISKM